MRSLLPLTVFAIGLLALQARAGEPAGIATIVDGKAWLVRGANLHPLKEGMALAAADILETEARTHVQIEFPDGSALGLGPATSTYLSARPQGAGKPGELLLHLGWVKVSGPASAGLLRVLSSSLSLHPKSGAFVLRREDSATECFVEAGELIPSAGGRSGLRWEPRKAGEFAEFKADHTLNILNRPTATFRAAIPRPFLDTLPSRFGKFSGKKVEPEGERPLSSEEADRWVRAFPSERGALLRRFANRLKDRATKGSS
ncbi:FecR domain-containing protein [Geothrix sp. PMB-07]|uniref:FecR domain-containing protein n=1 Tax=Geothrix sp. PMB-07 TaxID=3068640 RepID=UPI0027414E34|nr:FecR domain-containing protein [Geothrix sp. PMB-07]WLT31028.1 FecR domain-containing protein [Geothrix sp. PMB-07]